MLKNEWQHLGEDISDIVQGAIDAKDFDRLNQTISGLVNNTIQDLMGGIKDAGTVFGNGPIKGSADGSHASDSSRPQRHTGGQAAGGTQIRKSSELFARTAGQRTLGTVCMVFGCAGIVCIGFALLIVLAGAALSGWFLGAAIPAGVLAALIAGCVFLVVKGSSLSGMEKRFQRYIKGLRGRTYGNIKDLALEVGKKEDFVKKDLDKMIDKGWFREGHMDPQKTCLMITDQVYEEYLLTARRAETLHKEKQEKEAQNRARGISPELQAVIEEGNAYIRRIRQSNDAIPGEEISAKMYRMEEIVRRIFERVEQHPENLQDIHKLMEYYLPTTMKLLSAYEELDRQPIQGENIQHSKKEIEDTIDTLNLAFEKLLDGLFKDTAWDVSTDISVLHTMLAQEGLGKSDF